MLARGRKKLFSREEKPRVPFGYRSESLKWNHYYNSLVRSERKGDLPEEERRLYAQITYDVLPVVDNLLLELSAQEYPDQETFEVHFLQALYKEIQDKNENRIIETPGDATKLFVQEQFSDVLGKPEIIAALSDTEVGNFFGVPIEITEEIEAIKARQEVF